MSRVLDAMRGLFQPAPAIDDLNIPTFLRRAHPDHEQAAREGRKLLGPVARGRPPPPARVIRDHGRRRKRKTPAEVKTLEALGYTAKEVRGLKVAEAARVCCQGKPAAHWRLQRVYRGADVS